MKSEIILIFIEQDSKRCQILNEQIQKITLPKNCKYSIYCNSFENQLTDVFSKLDEQESKLAPSFVFIDPFGYAQTPFSIIEKIMSFPKCEFMITFVYDYINRFIRESNREPVFTQLFGTEDWKEIDKETTPEGRKKFIHDLYMRQLHSKAKVRYLRSFQMINKNGHTEYFLIYGTNHIKGFKVMKEAMWKVDSTGEYTFSDSTNPNQTILFELEPNYSQLKKMIINNYQRKIITIDELEKFIIEETPFLIKHLRKPILIPMENSDPPEIIIIGERRKNQYPSGCKINFL